MAKRDPQVVAAWIGGTAIVVAALIALFGVFRPAPRREPVCYGEAKNVTCPKDYCPDSDASNARKTEMSTAGCQRHPLEKGSQFEEYVHPGGTAGCRTKAPEPCPLPAASN